MTPEERRIAAQILQSQNPYGPSIQMPQPGQPVTELPDLGFGPMTQSTRQGIPNDTLSEGPPTWGQQMGQMLMDYGPMPAKAAVGVAEALPGAVMDPFMRAYQLSQDAANAGGFSNLDPGRVARDSLPMALMTFGGAPLGGGLPKGALGQSGTSPTLWEGAKDYAIRGAMPGAAAGGLYEASQGGSREDMLEGAGVGAALGFGALGVKRALDSVTPDDIGRSAREMFTRRGSPAAPHQPASGGVVPTPSAVPPGSGGAMPGPNSTPTSPQAQSNPLPNFAPYSPATHGAESRRYLDEILTTNHNSRSSVPPLYEMRPEHMAAELERRYARRGFSQVDPDELRRRASGTNRAMSEISDILGGTNSQITNPRLRQSVISGISGKPYTLALPATAGLGAATSDQEFDPVAMGRYLVMQQF